MRVLAVLFLGVTVACAADRCSPPLELAEFVNTLPADNGARRAAIEERLKQTPGDVALHRMFVDSSVYERKPIRERYQRLLESQPGSLDYQYLQARSLVGSDTRQALRIYAQILEKDPWLSMGTSLAIGDLPRRSLSRPRETGGELLRYPACMSLLVPAVFLLERDRG